MSIKQLKTWIEGHGHDVKFVDGDSLSVGILWTNSSAKTWGVKWLTVRNYREALEVLGY